MKSSYRLGTFGGIAVYIHWTFGLIVALYVLGASSQSGPAAGLAAGAFVLSLFACVLLHEFGHAIAAGWYGIPTTDITLWPIGGVARLQRLPDRPLHELVIALAGPLVNVIIAVLLMALLVFGVILPFDAPLFGQGMDFLFQLMVANVVLVLFNLLPAFPMDGGRVLRSLLAMRSGQLRATEVAASVGRWMALAFAVIAVLYGPWTLLLVAGFVYLAGSAELMQVRYQARTHSTGFPMAGGSPFVYRYSSHSTDPSNGHWSYQVQPDPNDDGVIDAIEVKEIRRPGE